MQGNLSKMQTHLTPQGTVDYTLMLNAQPLALNPLLGQALSLHYTGVINCLHCGRKTSKSFNQGYCYPCFTKLAQCDTCILKPHTCHYAQGTCREPDWAQTWCMQPHIVYLANASGLKVGITRFTQVPTRWIDQGAIQALPIMQVASRRTAGLVEMVLAQHVSDKTQWQRMLKGQVVPLDLNQEKERLLKLCAPALQALAEPTEINEIQYLTTPVVNILFPVLQYPQKVKAFNLDTQAQISGVLQGIKGQYWILDTGVINVRKFGGYCVSVSY